MESDMRNATLTEEQMVRTKYLRALERNSELAQLCVMLGRLRPDLRLHQVAADARQIHARARGLARYALQMCNGPELTERDNAAQRRYANDIQTIAAWYGLHGSYHGDPRGYVVKLYPPGVPCDGSADGFGVA
jgi:hypothetical protein